MFELSVALKYLIPRKKQLSVSLIALMSVSVISLVVWLVLVFLSVTEGIERNWLTKLTSLNAPIRITPTEHYYNSYFYNVDAHANASSYKLKNIAQKRTSSLTDPFDPDEDEALPSHFPSMDLDSKGELVDPVVRLYKVLDQFKEKYPRFAFQDFELSGALMRLQLLRKGVFPRLEDTQSYLTQVSYLATFPEKCPYLDSLLLPPTEKDVNHLLYLSSHTTEHSRQDTPALTLKTEKEIKIKRVQNLLNNFKIEELRPKHSLWQIPPSLLPQDKPFKAFAYFRNNQLSRVDIPAEKNALCPSDAKEGLLNLQGNRLHFNEREGEHHSLPLSTPLLIDGKIPLNVDAPAAVSDRGDPLFQVRLALQEIPLKGTIGMDGLEASKVQTTTPSLLNEEQETGVYLAKSFQESGVFIGDRGYLSYSSATASSVQEHRLPIFVAGFYDPGILSVGSKCILVPPAVTQAINSSNSSFNLDKTQSNGLMVWFENLDEASQIKQEISAALIKEGIAPYWKISTFKEYDFAKDLMEQFQSDKYLFTLVGIIILLVACCNIISLLVLLVNDKKKEIGVLQAMGASRKSIALIFGICGISMGLISSIIGIFAAIITLQNIDSLVQLLSFFQGHEAFNSTFFGKALPNAISHNALFFILIATPLLSLLAGLVPALKACRLRPSEILRSE